MKTRLRRAIPRWGAAALAAAAAAGLARPAQAQLGRPEVREVRFQGNRAFPSDSLARAIVTRGTECRSVFFAPFCWAGADFAIRRAYLPRRDFPLDLVRLKAWYQLRGYREASMDTTTATASDGAVAVTFLVDEGRPVLVDSIEFFGAEELSAPDIFRDLPLRVGDPLSGFAADAARDTLTRRLANRGYARAEVLRSSIIGRDDPYAARVTFDIAPGPRARYGHVSVSGNGSLTESTVLRTLQFRAGDVYRLDQLQEAQARLFGLEIVRSASVVPDFVTGPDSVIPVSVIIQEGDPHRVRSGAGWSSAECLDLDSRWVSRNFLGGGRRVQVRGRVSNILARDFKDLLCWQSGEGPFGSPNWIASVDFAQPWIFSTRNSFQASLYGERQSLPDVFVRRALGFSFAVTRAIGPRTPLTVSYRPELSRLDAAEILFCQSFLVCTPQDISILQGANWLAALGIDFTRNTTNNVLNPSRGYSVTLGVEHAAGWTGSNFAYDRLVAEGARYERVGGSGVAAARLRLGVVEAGVFDELLGRRGGVDIVHPQKRFYAGGANSVRGYPQSRLGPRVLTTDVVHLLEPVDPEGRGGGAGCAPEAVVDLSCDATPLEKAGRLLPRATGGTRVLEGSLETRFAVASAMQAAVFTDFGQVWGAADPLRLSSLRVTPGFGIRYLSPIGPLRVDLAYRFSGGESLAVVTNQLRPYDETSDEASDRLEVDGGPIPWVLSEVLAVLGPRVFFDDSPAGSLRRWQLHVSIGQAF